jgi:hypothetical protein
MRRPERVPSQMRAEPSPAMTLGNAAKATVRKHRSSMTKATRSIFDLIQDRLQGADTRRQRVVVGIGLAPLLAEAEIVVGHIWRPSFPPAPRLRQLQSVAAGLDLLDTETVPKGFGAIFLLTKPV